MKKSYQIQRDLVVPANSTQVFNFQLKETYAKCTGVFLTPFGGSTDFSQLTLGLNIAQTEVLPNGVDASLIALTDYIGRADATYDFKEENIPAKSSDVQLSVTNLGSTEQKFNMYFILENI
ncbi:MAG: hypothetical protein IKR17_04750 [Bacteroidales bacterium]|jgi:hypothetical protein|nr:hypothetical protein [Bacteroidales bacterium]